MQALDWLGRRRSLPAGMHAAKTTNVKKQGLGLHEVQSLKGGT